MNNLKPLNKQSGVALITVLFMFAVAVVIMANIVEKLDQDIDAYSAYLEAEQAYMLALSGEELARSLLAKDIEDSPGVDHLNEDWAKGVRYEVDNGSFEMQIEDLHGQFNINNVIDGQGKRDGNYVVGFKDLLISLEVDGTVAGTAATQLGDWIDANTGGQTPDSDYLALDIPYRPANARVAHISEMRMLLDMDKESYKEIKEKVLLPSLVGEETYLTALPESGTKVNVNTVSAEVLASLHSKVQMPSAESAVGKAKEKENGFRSVGDFLKELPANTLTEDELTVESNYFAVKVKAQFGEQSAFLISVLHRDSQSGNLSLISRDRSQRFILEISEDTENKDSDDEDKAIEI